MANVVAKIMLKMKLVSTDKVVFINNSLELIGSYVGQTPAKVDAKVEEAKGGVIFIDEAYSIVKDGGSREGSSGSFGREAIDTIMKHLDPPSCVFIFAGYEKPMNEFLKVNEGLARRIPYRYSFEPYNEDQLMQIFVVMCESKGESLEDGLVSHFLSLLNSLPKDLIDSQNAGLIANWVSFAQMERDDRISIEEAEKNPSIASLLTAPDFETAVTKLKEMKSGQVSDS
jgi:hypothetical protein